MESSCRKILARAAFLFVEAVFTVRICFGGARTARVNLPDSAGHDDLTLHEHSLAD